MQVHHQTSEVGLLLYPGCQMASVHGFADAFSVANSFAGEHGSAARVISSHWQLEDGGCKRVWSSEVCPGELPDVVIIPGRLAVPIKAEEAGGYAGWLKACHGRGITLASVCIGAFILGHAGLLAGRRVTTHWFFSDAFRAAFPEAELMEGDILAEDGEILTAAGMMAWTDLALRLIHRILGPTVLAETAKFLLVDPAGREQRHYSRFSPRLNHGDGAILKVQHWLQGRLGKDVSIPAMAREAGLEPRTFMRRFLKSTGLRPTEYVQDLRIAHARQRLEFTRDPVEQIAWEVGYSEPAAFRKIFQRITGLSATAYRERFSLPA